MNRLEGKIAVVSGGASGIGAECARRLAAEGASYVFVADINIDLAEAVAAEIVRDGGRASAHRLDIADPQSVADFFDFSTREKGALHVLLNNAFDSAPETLSADGAVAMMNVDVWDRTFRINTRGTMLMTKFALPRMVRSGVGSIVNISSGAAVVADVWRPAYAASKNALHAFTRSVATQYGKLGIRCNAICPGLILTPALRATLTQDVIDMVERQTLTPRLGIPSDIAAMVTLLASEDGAFITGQVINVDGGNTIHYGHVAEIYDTFLAATGRAGTE